MTISYETCDPLLTPVGLLNEQERRCIYSITFCRFRVRIAEVEKQYVLHILSV